MSALPLAASASDVGGPSRLQPNSTARWGALERSFYIHALLCIKLASGAHVKGASGALLTGASGAHVRRIKITSGAQARQKPPGALVSQALFGRS